MAYIYRQSAGLRKLTVTANKLPNKLLWNSSCNFISHCTRLQEIKISGGCRWDPNSDTHTALASFAFLKHLAAMPSVTSLDLSVSGMTAIPEQLGLVTSLQRLNLSYNEFFDDDEGFGSFQYLAPLTQLSSLNLSECDFNDEPPCLSALADSLRDVDLSDNDLVSIDTLISLHGLTSLDVSDNLERSVHLPDNVVLPFPLLQRLNVSYTELDANTIEKLAANVQLLQVHENHVKDWSFFAAPTKLDGAESNC